MDQAQAYQRDEGIGSLLSPAAVIMLFVAVMVDGGEFFVEMIPAVGNIMSIMIDIFAVVFFGFWMWFRSGTITVPVKTGKRLANFAKMAKKLKWIRPLCFIVEMLPIVSSVLPLWIFVVYMELKHNN